MLKKYIFITLLSFAIGAFIITVCGRGVAAKISGFDENFYLKYYYSITNRAKHKTEDAREAITIFDISKYQSRTDIARIIDSLVAYSPKVIGIDVFFINNPDINDSINNSLIKSLKRAQGTLVVPYIEKHTSLLDNYDIQLLSGIPQDNMCFDNYQFFNDSLQKEKMPVTIAKKHLGKENFHDEDILINYVSKDFLCISDIDDISFYKDKIRDGIVLVGDVYDIKDIKNLPFSIAQIGNTSAVSSTLPGIGNIAYIVNTLISTNTSKNTFTTETCSKKANAPLKYLPCWFNILISFFLTFIYLLLYERLCKTGSKESMLSKCFFIISKPLLLIFYMIIVTALAFSITSTTNYIPDLLLFLSGSFLIETFYDLYTLKTK